MILNCINFEKRCMRFQKLFSVPLNYPFSDVRLKILFLYLSIIQNISPIQFCVTSLPLDISSGTNILFILPILAVFCSFYGYRVPFFCLFYISLKLFIYNLFSLDIIHSVYSLQISKRI